MKYPNEAHVPRRSSRSWDGVAGWYAGWVGKNGSRHHTERAIPLALDLLQLEPGDKLIDLGCGPGVMAPSVAAAGAHLTGIDLSPRLIETARRNHSRGASFRVGDVTRIKADPAWRPQSFDAALFLLSIQDIDPLEQAVASAAWLLRPGGRLVYVTCSLLAEENTAQVNAFLERHPVFSLQPYADRWRETLPGEPPASADGRADTLLLTPASHDTDGFFIASFIHAA